MLQRALRSNQAMHSELEALALSALVKQQAATAIRWLPEANPLRQAMPLALENRHSLAAGLDLLQEEQPRKLSGAPARVPVAPAS